MSPASQRTTHVEAAARLYKPDRVAMSSPLTMIGAVLLADFVVSMIASASRQSRRRLHPLFTASPVKIGGAAHAFLRPEPYEWRGDPKHTLVTVI